MRRTLPKYWVFSGFLALIFAATGLFSISASAQSDTRSYARAPSETREFAAQARPRITVHPRRQLGPNAKRYCQFWLAKEYRISGTVITPQQRCWWN